MEAKNNFPIKLKEFFPEFLLQDVPHIPNIPNNFMVGDLTKISYSGAVWKIIRFTEYYGFVENIYCLIPNAILEREDVRNGAILSHPLYLLKRNRI